jgi:hypothetical protein
MLQLVQWGLIGVALALPLSGTNVGRTERFMAFVSVLSTRRPIAIAVVGLTSLVGCVLVASIIHAPVPLIHDEFSYLLASNTLASGHIATPSPPLSRFFDTFHVFVQPVYASKYFPGQGLFLAFGELVTGHPVAGVWLGAALACAATCWMLQAWISPTGGLVGGLLMAVEWSIYSYWGQSYWGGMVAALGGALLFGAARRLWDAPGRGHAYWAAIGVAILVLSRPAEGLIVTGAVCALPLRRWRTPHPLGLICRRVLVPVAVVLIPTGVALGLYNHGITGSAWVTPYELHEQQYQETPQFTVFGLRPAISYSSGTLATFYRGFERRLYDAKQGTKNRLTSAASAIREWWGFYLGALFTGPIVVLCWTRGGWIGQVQRALLVAFVATTGLVPGLEWSLLPLTVTQGALLWAAIPDRWARVAIGISLFLLLESLVVKWFQPHYFAPAACLVIATQVSALRCLWNHRTAATAADIDGSEPAGRGTGRERLLWRPFVATVPIICALLLALQVLGRVTHWWQDLPRSGAATFLLPQGGWSLQRVELQRWLSAQPQPQLVFVRYTPQHNVLFEWVFNHANILEQHVIWARDLGDIDNRQLVSLLPGRQVWTLDADAREPRLREYDGVATSPLAPAVPRSGAHLKGSRLPW